MNQDEIILPDGSKYIGELKDGKPHHGEESHLLFAIKNIFLCVICK